MKSQISNMTFMIPMCFFSLSTITSMTEILLELNLLEFNIMLT